MILTLTGNITHKGDSYAVVEVGGVGYQVHFQKAALLALHVGQGVRVWTHEHIREDARDLFGFATAAEHAMFLKLLAISGVGPKMAQNILSLGTVSEIEKIIDRADVERISTVPGIGKKTAQKIVLELKGKLVALEDEGGDDEVIAALVNLGYPRERAKEAAARVVDVEAVEDRLRAALKTLAK